MRDHQDEPAHWTSIRADVDPSVEHPHATATSLIEHGRIEDDARIARVNRRAAGQQGVGLGRAAVVGQRAELGIVGHHVVAAAVGVIPVPIRL